MNKLHFILFFILPLSIETYGQIVNQKNCNYVYKKNGTASDFQEFNTSSVSGVKFYKQVNAGKTTYFLELLDDSPKNLLKVLKGVTVNLSGNKSLSLPVQPIEGVGYDEDNFGYYSMIQLTQNQVNLFMLNKILNFSLSLNKVTVTDTDASDIKDMLNCMAQKK